MPDYAIEEINERSAWDQILDDLAPYGFMQAWDYGSAMQQQTGWQVERSAILCDGVPIAAAQVLYTRRASRLIARALQGPTLTNRSTAADAVINLLHKHWVQDRGARFHISPFVCISDDSLGVAIIESLKKTGFHETRDTKWGSVVLDLTSEEEELKRKLRARTFLNYGNRAFAVDFSAEPARLMDFIDSFADYQTRKQFSWPAAPFLRTLIDQSPNSVEVMTIRHDDEIVHQDLWYRNSREATYLAVQVPENAFRRNVSEYAIWRLLLRAKCLGANRFDLGGIDEARLPTLTYFKRRFLPLGEEYHLIGHYEASPTGSTIKSSVAVANDKHVMDRVRSITAALLSDLEGWNYPISDEQELITSGLLDSLSILTLATELDIAFSLELDISDIRAADFNTVNDIARFIAGNPYRRGSSGS